MDFPQPQVAPLHVSTFSAYGGPAVFRYVAATGFPVSATWPVANTAYYIPIYLPFHYDLRRFWWVNSSSVTSTNRDMGIFTAGGVKLASTGSTAAAGTSAPQYTALGTPILLPPGRYYLGISSSSTTASRGTYSASVDVPRARLAGILQEASALPLPATMTGIAVANAVSPLVGITSTASGF